MKIMVLGLGVIGTTYGYIFQKAGHTVEHFIRERKKEDTPKDITVTLLDGRYNRKGEEKTDRYHIAFAKPDRIYDFIFISVSAGKLADAIRTINDNKIQGTIVILNCIWEEKSVVRQWLGTRRYILGYPVAGGVMKNSVLDCVLFDHIMLEGMEKAETDNYHDLKKLLSSCDMNVEIPYDMLEWIWIHMAINAGVITTAGTYGDVTDPSQAAENVMNSAKALSEVILTVREAVKIIASRGVELSNYRDMLSPYKIPSKIAGIAMKRMFAKNELTRKIMSLHSNVDDLLYICKNIYDSGKNNGIKAPLLYDKYERIAVRFQKATPRTTAPSQNGTP